MRQVLLMALVLAGSGCQGLQDRTACRRAWQDCPTTEAAPSAEKKLTAPGPAKPMEKIAAPRPEVNEAVRAPAIAQDVLLVPKMVYIPYVAQTPVAPARLTSSTNIVGGPRDVGEERPPPGAEDKAQLKKLLEVCEKQCERIDYLEKCLRERNACPPSVICPPRLPLLRRPLFPRCEPSCETMVPCEPVEAPIPLKMPAPAGSSPRQTSAIVTIE